MKSIHSLDGPAACGLYSLPLVVSNFLYRGGQQLPLRRFEPPAYARLGARETAGIVHRKGQPNQPHPARSGVEGRLKPKPFVQGHPNQGAQRAADAEGEVVVKNEPAVSAYKCMPW